jgi:DNA-binding MarR family transcriptional regulator
MTPRARAEEGSARHDRATRPSAAQHDAAPADAAPDNDDAHEESAARVWGAMRELVGSHSTRDRMRAALDLGRGIGRFKSLMWLAEGPMSLSGLAEAVGVDAPYATLIVDSLEQRGLVERQPDPADRRRKLVTLTPAGSEAIGKLLRIEREPPPGFARLSTTELETLEALLHRIAVFPRGDDPPVDPPAKGEDPL